MKLKQMGVSKGLFENVLENFVAQGGQIFHFPERGVTVAVRPCCGANSRFCEVSMAFCDLSVDKFRKKTGTFLAVDRWESGEFVKVPMWYDDPVDIAANLAEVFGHSAFTY